MAETKKQKKTPVLWRSFREVYAASHSAFFKIYTVTLLEGIVGALPIFFMERLFEDITAFEAATLPGIALTLLSLFLIKAVGQALSGYGNYLYEYHDLLVCHTMTYKANRKVGHLGGILFEEKKKLEQIEKAYQGTGKVRKLVDATLLILLNYLPSFFIIGLYLYQASPFLPLLLLLVFIPVLLAQVIKGRYHEDLEDAVSPFNRKVEAYGKYVSDTVYFKETRMLGMVRYFLDKMDLALLLKIRAEWSCRVRSNLVELTSRFVSVAGYLVILAILFRYVLKNEVSVAFFAAVFTSLDGLFNSMEEMVTVVLGEVAEISGKIRNYFALQDMPEPDGGGEAQGNLAVRSAMPGKTPVRSAMPGKMAERSVMPGKTAEHSAMTGKTAGLPGVALELEDVSFRYPGSERMALAHVSLKVGHGDTVAIVGENGSGKTTLVRILAGIYPPSEGRVLYNGRPMDALGRDSVHKGMSAVFQNFGKYGLTVEENIRISAPGSGCGVERAAETSGFCMSGSSFAEGFGTLLSRDFGGVDLSGGQWQRLAIARGIYKENACIFLDEPTSAIDPFEEASLYQTFGQLAQGRTMFLVTHRLGAVKLAKLILVMKEGRMIGQGTHEELLAHCGEYAAMWATQSGQYSPEQTG